MPIHRFSYQPPTAGRHEVGLAGEFSHWAILDLMDTGGIYVLPLNLEQGKYRYKFIVDGVWMPDPTNPLREADPFGGENSVLIVAQESAPRLSWQQIGNDASPLNDRIGHYYQINRLAENDYELRFFWYPGLPAALIATIDGWEMALSRLGVQGTKDVYHCLFCSSEAVVHILIRIVHEGGELLLGAEGFSATREDNRPWTADLKELPVFSVPYWVNRGVIYQIFPDRFCNGDPALNPDFSEWYYDDCRTPPPEGEYLPPQREYYHLEPDWRVTRGLRQSPWLPEGKPDWWSFYGGDIPGIISKLDYLGDLGVTILYFNPLCQAKSNHKYDAAFFDRIDPHFGNSDDMRALVKQAHQRGMRIIVDVAFNHTGETFWAFRDCVEKGPDSDYWNWYDWHRWPLPKPLPPDFKPKEYYQCWWGIKDMPDLNFDLSRAHPSENYVREIAKAVPNSHLVEHLLQCVEWWLTDIGIDGFRLDVPDEVPFWFWELFRARVKALKPDAWIVGEIWQSAPDWVGSRYFDSVMNYAHFKNPVLEFLILKQLSREEFVAAIEGGLALYPVQAAGAMMNLLGSHDTLRVYQLAGGDLQRLELAYFFQMTFVGAPHIYYGDEIAMSGGRDPDNRRPLDWDWADHPEAVEFRAFLKSLIALRKTELLLTEGEFAFLTAPDGILAYERRGQTGQLTVAMNYSTGSASFPLPAGGETLFTLGISQADDAVCHLEPCSAVIIRFDHALS